MAKKKSKNDVDAVDELLAALELSEDQLIPAALNQPSLFAKAADWRISTMRDRARLEGQLKALRAEKSLAYRRDAEQAGEKVTEGGVTARIESDSDVMTLADDFREATVLEEHSDLLIQAFRARANSIRIIADLKQTDVYHGQKVSTQNDLDDIREKLRNKYPGK